MPIAALVALACTGCATGLTGDPATISDDDAKLRGSVVSDAGGEVEYWVEYGPTQAYGSASDRHTVPVEPNAPVEVDVAVSGLERSTGYHYRLCAQDAQQQGGPGCGEDRRFKTQSFACGDTVTGDVRLTGSMKCPGADPGLVVGAPGIDINLAGHTIFGPSALDDIFDTTPVAILNAGGHDDVTVRNGTIAGWNSGIRFDGAARTSIARLQLRILARFSSAIRVTGAEDSQIRHVTADAGMQLSDAAGAVIADSTVFGNGSVVILGHDSRIVRITAGPGQDFTAGLGVLGNRNRIADSRAFGYPNGNIDVIGGAGNVVVDNEVFGLPVNGSRVGIRVRDAATGTVVRRNLAHDNFEDGIEVLASSTRLGDNTANDNTELGIDAVPGVIDLGGNRASGNGNPLQCVTVFCQ